MKKKTESEPMTAEEQKIRGLIGRPTKKELERMYLDIWEENKSLKQQLDGKLEESKEYQSMVKSQKNPFGAGRKREHTEQLEKIMELHAQGLSHRAISEIVKVPSATVGRYIKQMNQNNIDL